MKIETVEHNGNFYPKYTSNGNATRFYEPFALEVCKGFGVDVGCNRIDWMFNNKNQLHIEKLGFATKEYCLENTFNSTFTFPIDPVLNGYSATNFPSWC